MVCFLYERLIIVNGQRIFNQAIKTNSHMKILLFSENDLYTWAWEWRFLRGYTLPLSWVKIGLHIGKKENWGKRKIGFSRGRKEKQAKIHFWSIIRNFCQTYSTTTESFWISRSHLRNFLPHMHEWQTIWLSRTKWEKIVKILEQSQFS